MVFCYSLGESTSLPLPVAMILLFDGYGLVALAPRGKVTTLFRQLVEVVPLGETTVDPFAGYLTAAGATRPPALS